MGPMLLTGLACLGATLGQALVVSATPPEESLPVRRLAVVTMGFAEGIAVLAVVAGLLAVFEYAPPTPADGLLAGAPAVVGAIVALAIILRNRAYTNAAVTTIGLAFILGLGFLGTTVWVLAALEGVTRPAPLDDGPFVILGAVAGLAALAVCFIGSHGVRGLANQGESEAASVASAHISKIIPLDLIGVGACAFAIVLLVNA